MKKGLAYAIATYLIWGCFSLMWKALEQMSPMYILASRILFSFAFTSILLSVTHRWGIVLEVLRKPKLALWAAVPGAIISINWFVVIVAINSGRALDSTLGMFMNTLACCIAGIFFFREIPNRIELGALGLAALGVVIMSVQYGKFPWIAIILSLTFGIYSAMKKNIQMDYLVALFLESLIMLPAALPAVLYLEATGAGALATLSGWRLALVPMLGVITVTPLLFYAKSVHLLPLSMTGFLQYIQSIIAFLIALLVFGEQFSSSHAVGYAFIWGSLVVYTIGSHLPHRASDKVAPETAVAKPTPVHGK